MAYLSRSLRQHRQMLANPHAGGARRDRLKLAANRVRRVRLHVEAVEMREATRQEDEDDRACSRRIGVRQPLQRGKLGHTQAEQPQGARLQCPGPVGKGYGMLVSRLAAMGASPGRFLKLGKGLIVTWDRRWYQGGIGFYGMVHKKPKMGMHLIGVGTRD